MHVRVVSAPLKPDAIPEGVAVFENSVAPAMKEQPGFVGAMLLVNETENKFISFSQWETEADMQASEASGYLQAQMAKIATMLAAPPANEHFELAAQG